MITVMGAGGRVGVPIAALLLASGEKVRALGRSVDRVAGVAGKGATVLTGDAADATFLTEAFRGADAAFTLLPEDVHAADFRKQQRRGCGSCCLRRGRSRAHARRWEHPVRERVSLGGGHSDVACAGIYLMPTDVRGESRPSHGSYTSQGPIASCSQYVTASTCQRMKRRPPS
jgi:NmrA-like family